MEHLNQVMLADLWRRIMNTEPPPEDQVGRWRRSSEPIDLTPQPGFVGSNYRTGGTLILGMNPGSAARAPEQGNQAYYKALAELRNATDHLTAFKSLNETMEGATPNWPLHQNLVRHVLCACGLKLNEIAQVNLFKWRTTKISAAQRNRLYEWNWPQTSEQVRCLEPEDIIVLGVNVGDFLAKKWGNRKLFKVIPRTLGDKSISPAAKDAIEKLRLVGCKGERANQAAPVDQKAPLPGR